jgi:hypothetical protein
MAWPWSDTAHWVATVRKCSYNQKNRLNPLLLPHLACPGRRIPGAGRAEEAKRRPRNVSIARRGAGAGDDASACTGLGLALLCLILHHCYNKSNPGRSWPW